mgnify:CR=1 FL=1
MLCRRVPEAAPRQRGGIAAAPPLTGPGETNLPTQVPGTADPFQGLHVGEDRRRQARRSRRRAAQPAAYQQPHQPPDPEDHLPYTLLSTAGLLLTLYSLLRLALLFSNRELIGSTSAETFIEAFYNGLCFELRVVVFAFTLLLLALLSVRAMAARGLRRARARQAGRVDLAAS